MHDVAHTARPNDRTSSGTDTARETDSSKQALSVAETRAVAMLGMPTLAPALAVTVARRRTSRLGADDRARRVTSARWLSARERCQDRVARRIEQLGVPADVRSESQLHLTRGATIRPERHRAERRLSELAQCVTHGICIAELRTRSDRCLVPADAAGRTTRGQKLHLEDQVRLSSEDY